MGRKKTGLNRRQRPPSQRSDRRARDPDLPEYLAIHEAGHAVAAAVLGLGLGKVSLGNEILDDGSSIGGFAGTLVTSESDLVGIGGDRVLPYLVLTMAGPQAEIRVNPLAFSPTGHAQLDMEAGHRITMRAICQGTWQDEDHYFIDEGELIRCKPECDGLVEVAAFRTKQLIDQYFVAIQRVAVVLLDRKSIEGSEVTAIVNASTGTS